jgi:hypothetical protein
MESGRVFPPGRTWLPLLHSFPLSYPRSLSSAFLSSSPHGAGAPETLAACCLPSRSRRRPAPRHASPVPCLSARPCSARRCRPRLGHLPTHILLPHPLSLWLLPSTTEHGHGCLPHRRRWLLYLNTFLLPHLGISFSHHSGAAHPPGGSSSSTCLLHPGAPSPTSMVAMVASPVVDP